VGILFEAVSFNFENSDGELQIKQLCWHAVWYFCQELEKKHKVTLLLAVY